MVVERTDGVAALPPGRPPAKHWVVAAVGLLCSPVLLWLAFRFQVSRDDCVRAYGPDSTQPHSACSGAELREAFAVLAFYSLALTSTIVGLILGLVDGQRRRRFARGRWISATVIGLSSPWALAAYSLAYGGGRLLPAKKLKPSPAVVAAELDRHGFEAAVKLYRGLARGEVPTELSVPGFMADSSVFMDIPFGYSRFYPATVTYAQTSTVAFGSPGFVAAALLANAAGNRAARSRAENLARAQWREHAAARTVLTATSTWCCVDGRWLAFDHERVVDFAVDGSSCVLTFAGTEPLRLHGPSAWCHAVLFAYLRFGPERWRQHASPGACSCRRLPDHAHIPAAPSLTTMAFVRLCH